MKKIFMTLIAAFAAMSMNAQVYVGGSFAFEAWSSQKLAGDKSETVFKLMPEIGYNLNNEWAIGTVIGYQSDKFNGVNGVSESAFSIAPYARYTFTKLGKVNLFVDGGISFTSASKADWTELAIGFEPGLAINLTDNLSFVSHIGFIGYDLLNPDGDDNNISKFGLSLDATDVTFGLYYNF
jgi:opacity protein-like surface antigen